MGKKINGEGFLERLGKKLDNANIWYKRIGAIGAIIVAIWGGCIGVAHAITSTLDSHIDIQTQHLANTLQVIEKETQYVRLDALRTQLLLYMYHEPHEHNTILEIARVYFVEYHGDWVMTNKFKQWAKEENIEIPFELDH